MDPLHDLLIQASYVRVQGLGRKTWLICLTGYRNIPGKWTHSPVAWGHKVSVVNLWRQRKLIFYAPLVSVSCCFAIWSMLCQRQHSVTWNERAMGWIALEYCTGVLHCSWDSHKTVPYWGAAPASAVPHPGSWASPPSGPCACQSQCSRSRCTSSPASQQGQWWSQYKQDESVYWTYPVKAQAVLWK